MAPTPQPFIPSGRSITPLPDLISLPLSVFGSSTSVPICTMWIVCRVPVYVLPPTRYGAYYTPSTRLEPSSPWTALVSVSPDLLDGLPPQRDSASIHTPGFNDTRETSIAPGPPARRDVDCSFLIAVQRATPSPSCPTSPTLFHLWASLDPLPPSIVRRFPFIIGLCQDWLVKKCGSIQSLALNLQTSHSVSREGELSLVIQARRFPGIVIYGTEYRP